MTAKLVLKSLNCDVIEEKPIEFDFAEDFWEIVVPDYDRTNCEQCNGSGSVNCSQCNGTEEITCSHCKGTGKSEDFRNDCDWCEGTGMACCIDCGDGTVNCPYCDGDGFLDSEDDWSPMMNFAYPISEFDIDDDVKSKLNNTTLVRIHGKLYLALTGGGMDLSWEICESYINLGFYPPVHFCDLPRMAGRGESDRDKVILAYCRESVRIKEKWCSRMLKRLEEFSIPEVDIE